MEDILVYIFWIVAIVAGIASSISKAAKKAKEAEGRASADGRSSGRTTEDSYTGASERGVDSRQDWKPVRKSLAERLEELAEQEQLRRETPPPTAWPVFGPVSKSAAPASDPEPAAMSHGYYSLETEYDAMPNSTKQTISTRTDISADALSMPIAEDDARSGNVHDCIALADILGGEFDLRRAVIEAEILTPKYGAGRAGGVGGVGAAAKHF